jgi:hypothetical protein
MDGNSDLETLAKAYNAVPEHVEYKFLGMIRDSDFVVWQITRKISDEWRSNHREVPAHQPYSDWPTIEYINDETHYEMVRQGLVWQRGNQMVLSLSEKEYQDIREQVITALARYAVHYFTKVGSMRSDSPPFRTSLADWMSN